MKLNIWLLSALAPLTAIAVLAQDTAPAASTAPKRKRPGRKVVFWTRPPPRRSRARRSTCAVTSPSPARCWATENGRHSHRFGTNQHPPHAGGRAGGMGQIAMPPVFPSGLTATLRGRHQNGQSPPGQLRGADRERTSAWWAAWKRGRRSRKSARKRDGSPSKPRPTPTRTLRRNCWISNPRPPRWRRRLLQHPRPCRCRRPRKSCKHHPQAAPVAAANEPAVAAPTAPAPTQQSEVEQELAALRRATPRRQRRRPRCQQ